MNDLEEAGQRILPHYANQDGQHCQSPSAKDSPVLVDRAECHNPQLREYLALASSAHLQVATAVAALFHTSHVAVNSVLLGAGMHGWMNPADGIRP